MRTVEEIREYQKQWREKNAKKRKEYAKKYHKEWYKNNKDNKDKKNREWDKANPEKRKQINKKYREGNKDVLLEKRHTYCKNFPEKVRETRIKYNQANVQKLRDIANEYNHSFDGIYRRYKSSAVKRDIAFDLTKDQFMSLIESTCVYCGTVEQVGVDRIDNSVGYTLENSASCCHYCNRMKWTHNKEAFLSHIAKIAKHRGIIYP